MISKETKERLCRKHRSLLELVYYFGKGIMFRQHILRYMEFDGIHEIDVSKSLLVLKKNEIIDFQDMFGARIIVLKKFAICFLLEKKHESVASIRFTMGKAKQSAFLNQHVLSNMSLFKKKKMLLLEENEEYFLKDLIKHFLTKTTYFNKDKESYLFLEKQIKDKDLFTEEKAEEEVQSLKLIKDNAWLFKKSSNEEMTYSFNLNSMQSSHIYFGIRTKLHGQSIDILDINGLMNHKKFVSKINKTKEYLNALFTKGNKFRFILYVQSEERKGAILKNEKQINELLRRYWNEDDIQWEVVDLNLEKTLFKNQKILLNV